MTANYLAGQTREKRQTPFLEMNHLQPRNRRKQQGLKSKALSQAQHEQLVKKFNYVDLGSVHEMVLFGVTNGKQMDVFSQRKDFGRK